MKKLFQISLASVIIFALLSVSAVSGFAYTYFYTAEGLKYRNVTKDTVAVSGISGSHETMTIPAEISEKTVVMIDDYAFRDNTELKSIDLSAVSDGFSLGEGAFLNCKALEHVTIPSAVQYLYEDCFRNCSALETADLQTPVAAIPENMFSGCSSLKEFTVPESVATISRYAFAYCDALEKVVIPKNVTDIAISAFYKSPNVTIYCYADSYAQTYAESRNIPYILLDEPQQFFLGDANGDGAVNINDVTTIQRHLADMETIEGIHFYAADVNSDASVTIDDATLLQMKFAEYNNVDYPIGEVITQ